MTSPAPTMTADGGNHALFLVAPEGPFEVRPAPMPEPGPGQVLVRQRATSINPIDALPGTVYAQIVPGVTFPTIYGSDVAGEVVALGEGVTGLHVGDLVLGLGNQAFQEHVVLSENMTATVPDAVDIEHAATLPLTLSTAATGLFQPDQLALDLPTDHPVDQQATVLVWGGSTSVGMNAIQLARNAGYRVISTASARNHDLVRTLGADGVVDRTSTAAVAELLDLLGGQPLAGVLAIGDGSALPCLEVASRAGAARVASTNPPEVASHGAEAQRLGVELTPVWGGAIARTHVGAAIFHDFLPAALADGRYRALPEPTVVGHGLADIPAAIERLRAGVSASKLVVTL